MKIQTPHFKRYVFLLLSIPLLAYSFNFWSLPIAPDYACPSCDLSGRDFSGQDLTDANLSNANLTGANLSNANLKGAILIGADLTGAKLNGARMGSSAKGHTNFAGADLTQTNFSGAALENTNFQYADITCADFSATNLTRATFGPLLKFRADTACQPSFKNATMSCEFTWLWDQFDLTGARLPACNNYRLEEKKEPDVRIPAQGKGQGETVESNTSISVTMDLHPAHLRQRNLSAYANSIYVSPYGSDTNDCGQVESPCQTIQQGIDRCSGSSCAVLVEAGEFKPTAPIQLKAGVSLFGGYFQGTATVYQTSIQSSQGSPVFTATDLNTTLTIHGFLLKGGTPQGAGQASTVVQLQNSTGITLAYCNVVAAPGTPGAAGSYGTQGTKGGDGKAGSDSNGGSGGVNGSCSNSWGGYGGAKSYIKTKSCSWCSGTFSHSEYAGESGGPGSTQNYAAGGSGAKTVVYSCPSTKRPTNPTKGADGRNAGCGSGGSASTNNTGTFANGAWSGSRGNNGYHGGNGGGGGGGSSGGSCGYVNCGCGCKKYAGTAGGGGGAGGCSGSPGQGGQQGGASFGIVLINATLTVADSTIVIGGIGGVGGNGGPGASGGLGGAGGAAVPSNDVCNNTGGGGSSGGKGGAGGASGGGAGGNGGPAVGIALVSGAQLNGTPTYYAGTSGDAGTKGGSAGPTVSGGCVGGYGADGTTGLVANTHNY